MANTSDKSLLKRATAIIGAVASGAMLMGSANLSENKNQLKAGETGLVTEVVDGDTLFLDNGLKVRLSAIQAPKLPLGRPGFKTWPLAENAKDALSQMAYRKNVQLFYGGKERDRYDRALAQAFIGTQDDLWIQEEMLRQGWARVYTWPDTWQNSDRLYAAEREARNANRGIWAHDYYEIRSPDPNNLAQDVDSFQIVEGIVTSVADIRGRIYLNFGADYKTDFTIAIEKNDRKRFKSTSYDLKELAGATVRIRGWVELTNGPIIWLDHPERLEVLN